MKIKLKSNVDLGGPFREGEMELKSETVTLRDLLNEISSRCGASVIDPKIGEVDPNNYMVFVNKREHWLLPKGLNTNLFNGEEVEVHITMLGGG